MQLEKAGKGALIGSMVISVIMIGLCCLLALAVRTSLAMILYVVLFVASGANAHLAYMLDETPGPLMIADPRGVTFNPALSPSGTVGWHDIKSMRITQWRYNFFFPVPFTKRLQIRFASRDHLPPLRRWLPHGWFGILSVPMGVIGGGSGALNQFVNGQAQLSQQAVFDLADPKGQTDPATAYRIMHGLPLDAAPQLSSEGRIDAAIQQALLRQKYGAAEEAPPPVA